MAAFLHPHTDLCCGVLSEHEKVKKARLAPSDKPQHSHTTTATPPRGHTVKKIWAASTARPQSLIVEYGEDHAVSTRPVACTRP